MKAIALTVAALVLAVALARSQSPPALAYPGSGKISAELNEALTKNSSARVIVSLATKPLPTDSLRPEDVRALRAEIAARQTLALRAISPRDFRLERRYRAVPALAGTASAIGVRDLAARSEVVQVALDDGVHALLGDAVPLIRADDVHSQLGVTGDGVVVAVLDTGIDTDHPLLADDLNYEKCFLASGTCPGGGTSGPSAEDGNGHGTHVSGIITSAGPPIGVAPDALIDAFKVLDDAGSGSFSDVLAAYDEIISSHPDVDVINMSLGTVLGYRRGTCEAVMPALTTAVATTRSMGMISFAAAGNNGQKARISYPACLNDVVSVGAVYDSNVGPQTWGSCTEPSTNADQVACFSQSDISLDLLAPGATIDSTWPGGGLDNHSGTSMASPTAAGVSALLLEGEPSLTPAQVETRMKETGVPVTDAANGVTTCRIDAYEAVANDGGAICASSGPPPPANDDFADAIVVAPPLPYDDSRLTFGATIETNEPVSCGNMGATAWYRYTPSDSELVLASTNGSNFQTALAVYTGTSLNSLTPVACDDGSDNLPSHALFEAQGATTYYLQVGGAAGDFGNLAFHLSEAKQLTCGQQSGPAMCLTMKNGAGQSGLLGCNDTNEPTECTAAIGAPFALTVQASGLPVDGYIGFQTETYLGGLSWKPRPTCSEEVVWPDQAFCASNVGPGGQALHGAFSTLSSSGPASTFQGGLVQIDITCPAAGTFEVALTAWPSSLDGAAYYGAMFDTIPVQVSGQRSFDTDGDTVTDAVLDIADSESITCVEAPTPTPTATPTPSPTPCPDLDGDTICDGVDPDVDGDGCPNADEQQTAAFSENTGGRRDYLNQYDYFNPTQDGKIRADDISAVVRQYYIDVGNPAYREDTDRTWLGPDPWDLGPPDGLQRALDIVNIVKQFFHDCS